MNRKGTAVLLLGVAIAAGCSLTTSFKGFTGANSEPGCPLLRWPDKPVNAEPGGSMSLIGAATSLNFFDEDAGIPPGLDVDGLCTCPDRGACIGSPGGGGPGRDIQCDDGRRGVDNKGGVLLKALLRSEEQMKDGIDRGLHGILVRVDHYNGKPDDRDVTVSIYNVVGVNGKTDGTGMARFDGADEFIVDEKSTIGPDEMAPRFFDTSAYVAGGTLVAFFDFDLRLLIPSTPPDPTPPSEVVEPLKAVHLVGRIEVADGGGLRMSSVSLGGRIPLSGMFLHAGPASVCADAGFYPIIKASVCDAIDLPADPAADGTDVACDALSFALRLDIAPGKLRNGAKAISTDPPCAPVDAGCN